jgi:hypothetical protein
MPGRLIGRPGTGRHGRPGTGRHGRPGTGRHGRPGTDIVPGPTLRLCATGPKTRCVPNYHACES